MMDFELRLERPSRLKPWLSAIVMGLSYFLGEFQHSIAFLLHNTKMQF